MMNAHPSHPSRPSRPFVVSIVGAVLLFAAVGLAWAFVPQAQPGLLLAGTAAAVAIYLVMYAIERRRHW